MHLDHIPLNQLQPSALNVRRTGGKDVGDLIASIRSLGLLQPLLVRRNTNADSDGDGFAVVAGQRRYRALVALAAEGVLAEPVPCLVMEAGDDATAIEASLAENIARLPMDEVDQYKAFAALRGEGLSVADIAARFGVTERLVEQRLAIAGIIAPVLVAYRKGDVAPDTLRILTMATPKQQKAWWALVKDPAAYAPTGRALRSWLFGGQQVPVANALFNIAGYQGAIVSDLFGDDRYVADVDAFWTLQDAAIAERKEQYLASGWRDVVVLGRGEHFGAWNHVRTTKKQGGRVYVEVANSGEVTFHEGWLTEKEARQRAKVKAAKDCADGASEADETGEDNCGMGSTPERSELTAAMRNYLALHRHAAVRTELLMQSGLALRLTVAHIIAGSPLWKVEVEPQRADSEAIAASVMASKAQASFAEERSRVRALLAWTENIGTAEDADCEGGDDGSDEHSSGDDNRATVVPSRYSFARPDITALMQTLLALDDHDVMRVLSFVMAESLSVSPPLVDVLGAHLGTDMANWWEPDETFFALLRDKKAINAMLREVAGDVAADAHAASTAKVQKKIIADCLSGDGRTKVEGWMPRYMAFPAGSYLGRGADHVAAPDAGDTEALEEVGSREAA